MSQSTHTSDPGNRIPSFYDSIQDIVTEQIAFYFILLVVMLWRVWILPRAKTIQLNLGMSVAQDREVFGILYQIMGVAQADRVLLAQFHNGEILTSRRHWVKMSVTHEAVNPGIERVQKKIQSIPTTRLTNELEAMESRHICEAVLSRNLPLGCRQHLNSLGVKRMLNQGLYDKNGTILGVVSIQYNSRRGASAKTIEQDISPLMDRLREAVQPKTSWMNQLKESIGIARKK